MFKIEIRDQARKLMDMLTVIVDTLDRSVELRPQLIELGKRHAGYGVQSQHYELLTSATPSSIAKLAPHRRPFLTPSRRRCCTTDFISLSDTD